LHDRLGLGDRTDLPTPSTLSGPPPALPRGAAYAWAAGGPAPFSPAWYAAHPNVFHVVYPHADAVAAVTAASLAAWLTIPTAVAVAGSESNTIVQTTVTEVESSTAASSIEPTPISEAASVSPNSADWLSVGVFALKSSESGQATRVVHLFVDRSGNLRGSQVDLLSQGVEEVQGTINRETQVATWTVGTAQTASFEVPVRALTEDEHDVTVRFANGSTETWRLVRTAP
jgi:hypothetical protein